MHTDFRHTMRVYMEDTDLGGVVFYVNYLKFFERARTEWLRSHGVHQSGLMAREGGGFAVVDTSVRFIRPAKLDDELAVTVSLKNPQRASLVFFQQASRGEELLAESSTRVIWVNLETFRPARFPQSLLDHIAGLEAKQNADHPVGVRSTD